LNRGYLREGYAADVAIVDMNKTTTDTPETVRYKCGWSPFDGFEFRTQIATTIVNGHKVYENGKVLSDENFGERLQFKSA
jgi:dihydroorotase